MGVITYGAVLQNEVKAWPPLVSIGSGLDLVTNAQWFADVGTPTTKATAVPVSGETGLDAKFLDAIKCVTDAVDEGWAQRYTYANEPRIKSGKTISAAIWVASTAGSVDCTVKLINSDASETAGVLAVTDGDWDLYIVEAHVCAGIYVDLQVTKDTTGTFYAGGPITVMLGEDAISLPPRKTVMRTHLSGQLAHDLNGAGAQARTDLDVTSFTSALAVSALCIVISVDNDSTDEWAYCVYPNFFAAGANQEPCRVFYFRVGDAGEPSGASQSFEVLLDDQQRIEDELALFSGTAVDTLRLYVTAFREWE